MVSEEVEPAGGANYEAIVGRVRGSKTGVPKNPSHYTLAVQRQQTQMGVGGPGGDGAVPWSPGCVCLCTESHCLHPQKSGYRDWDREVWWKAVNYKRSCSIR